MFLHLALVTEILATVLCIHAIYGRKVHFDVKTIEVIVGIVIVLEIANTISLGGILSLVIYVMLFIYSKSKFQSSMIDTIISLVLCMIVVTSIQLLSSSLVSLVIEHEFVRNTVSNILTLRMVSLHFISDGLHSLQKSVVRRSKFVIVSLSFMCLIILSLLLQGKVLYVIHMQYFILVVPAILLLLVSIVKGFFTQTAMEKMAVELHRTKEHEKAYDHLLTKVRLRQHEFQNHIAAVFSAHYTYTTYERLVQAQDEYCNKLLNENKYNNLLLLGENILAGYLYGKFQEAEDDGIEIHYKVASKLDKVPVPIYYVIEMIGILLDNSMEALRNSPEKIISFEILEFEDGYEFLVQNPFPYVSYDEISEWFMLDKSSKGRGRGLGLFHLKCLCQEWQCDVRCSNIEKDGKNWIKFILHIGKADDR